MFNLGMIYSPPDERDWHLPEEMVMASPELKAIRTPYRATPRNQFNYSTCAAEAMAQWVEANELRERGVRIEYSEGDIYAGREERDHKGEGMIPRQMLRWQMKHGAVRKSMFNVRNTYTSTITQRKAQEGFLKDEGLSTRIRGFVRLTSMKEIYAYMSEFQVGVLFGSAIDANYDRPQSNGVIAPFVAPSRGGHMVYCPDIVEINGRFLLAIQNSWGSGWGLNGVAYIDINEAVNVEIWGPLPEESSWYKEMPNEIILAHYKDGRDNTTMYVENTAVKIPLGPFYYKGANGETKLCTAIREPFEAIGAKVDWVRMETGDDIITIRPRKGGIFKSLNEIK